MMKKILCVIILSLTSSTALAGMGDDPLLGMFKLDQF